jgi:hypothetical protein
MLFLTLILSFVGGGIVAKVLSAFYEQGKMYLKAQRRTNQLLEELIKIRGYNVPEEE